MREIKFDYVLEVYEQQKTHRKRVSFSYADVFNGTAKYLLDRQKTVHGYVIIAKREYTGLKDKNGTEIYEGDIIKYVEPGDFDGDTEAKTEVSWHMDGGYWTIGDNERTLGDLCDWMNEVEVIGNIYENPELLETRNG